MNHVKTTVSLPAPLLKRAEALARKLRVSRSRLIALALESFTRRARAREMLEALNAAFEGGQDGAERLLGEAMRRQARGRMEGE